MINLQAGDIVGHTSGVEESLLLLGVIILAGIGTGILFVGSILAAWQRKEVRYILISAAVGALFFRSFVGIGTVYGLVPMTTHHLVEHSLDFLIAALVLYAVYRSKPSQPERSFDIDNDSSP